MAENVCRLLDNLSRHNSRAYGYELSQNEVLQILKLFDDVKELEQYRAIGTIEEFKALKEKNEPKEVAYQLDSWGHKHEKCPTCGSFHVFGKHCTECGQSIYED